MTPVLAWALFCMTAFASFGAVMLAILRSTELECKRLQESNKRIRERFKEAKTELAAAGRAADEAGLRIEGIAGQIERLIKRLDGGKV